MAFPRSAVGAGDRCLARPWRAQRDDRGGNRGASRALRVWCAAVCCRSVRSFTWKAARCIGAGNLRIITHHIVPNVLSPVLVLMSMSYGVGAAEFRGAEFLGVGRDASGARVGARC